MAHQQARTGACAARMTAARRPAPWAVWHKGMKDVHCPGTVTSSWRKIARGGRGGRVGRLLCRSRSGYVWRGITVAMVSWWSLVGGDLQRGCNVVLCWGGGGSVDVVVSEGIRRWGSALVPSHSGSGDSFGDMFLLHAVSLFEVAESHGCSNMTSMPPRPDTPVVAYNCFPARTQTLAFQKLLVYPARSCYLLLYHQEQYRPPALGTVGHCLNARLNRTRMVGRL